MITRQESRSGRAIRPELLLLAACAGRQQSEARETRVRTAAGNIHDWNEFVAAVHRHRMAAIAWNGLNLAKCALPAHIETTLRATALRDTRQVVKLVAVAASMQALFEKAGLSMMIAKGPPLSLLAYGDISLRQCRDLDVLVKPADILKARKILIDAGYHQNFPEGMDDEAELELWLWLKKDLAFVSPSGDVIELHSRLQRNPHLLNEAALQREPVQLAPNVTVQALAGDDLFIYLCLHGSGHLWERLKWLADVAALIEIDPSRLPLLWKRARQEGSAIAVGLALLLCQRLFDTDIPPLIRNDLGRIRRLRILEKYSLDRLAHKATGGERKFASTQMLILVALLRIEPYYLFHEAIHALVDWRSVAAFGGNKRAVFLSIVLRPFTWSWITIKRLQTKTSA
ncbi:nucleotidyltransferase family protein [Roseiarcaceae bacterium H3SJ34-1]|uniref:nucleotidyltransferase domain-containing protein n=1 Tax=Terripilifer ovatus TaxID=3032367 RepID=UPI003AB93DB1|nr:nucleotidyltransferase family protein [Roseiarcaceae bacterium H3SJ34-1]